MKTKFIRGKIEVKENGQGITVIASDETLDRHGDVLPIQNWDLTKFLLSPRMLVDHNHEVASIVGKWENTRIENNKLLMDANFHRITELSKAVEEMVKGGFLDTVSVGFIPHGPTQDGGNDSFELIETSWVTVPANPSARVQQAFKALEGKVPTAEEVAKIKEVVGVEEKGPACRQNGETKEECVARKIKEIIAEDPKITQDQAIAIAESVCSKACGKDVGDEDLADDPIEEDEQDDDGTDLGDFGDDEFDKLGYKILNSVEDFKNWEKGEKQRAVVTVLFLEGLIADSEKLTTLTQADKEKVEAEDDAKLHKLALKEAVKVINESLRRYNRMK